MNGCVSYLRDNEQVSLPQPFLTFADSAMVSVILGLEDVPVVVQEFEQVSPSGGYHLQHKALVLFREGSVVQEQSDVHDPGQSESKIKY